MSNWADQFPKETTIGSLTKKIKLHNTKCKKCGKPTGYFDPKMKYCFSCWLRSEK